MSNRTVKLFGRVAASPNPQIILEFLPETEIYYVHPSGIVPIRSIGYPDPAEAMRAFGVDTVKRVLQSGDSAGAYAELDYELDDDEYLLSKTPILKLILWLASLLAKRKRPK